MHPLHNLFPASGPLPAAYKNVLGQIMVVAGGVPVIAGGALRDHFHGVEVKDLDVFLPWDAQVESDLYEYLEVTGWECTQNVSRSAEGLNEVACVYGWQKPGELDLNIIFIEPNHPADPHSIAQRCDFGICQIAAFIENGQLQFEYTTEFIDDVEARTFTLHRTGDEGRSLKRWDRLREKFPNHTLITPHINSNELLPIL